MFWQNNGCVKPLNTPGNSSKLTVAAGGPLARSSACVEASVPVSALATSSLGSTGAAAADSGAAAAAAGAAAATGAAAAAAVVAAAAPATAAAAGAAATAAAAGAAAVAPVEQAQQFESYG